MKTLSIDEASSNLARWLQLALAGEEIGIRTGGAIVALRPAGLLTETEVQPAPREALRLLHATRGSQFPQRRTTCAKCARSGSPTTIVALHESSGY